MEQVKTAISGYLHFLQHAVPGDVMGGSGLSNKILGFAERNVASAFEFAQRLVQVRDAQELTKLQADFVQAQMQAMSEQAKDLGDTATARLPPASGSARRPPGTVFGGRDARAFSGRCPTA